MAKSKDWFKQWQELADSGDPDAQIVMAWEHVKGKLVDRDFDRAVILFRAAAARKPALARFNLAKAKILNRDETFEIEIREDCKAGFAPALYLMGVVEKRGIFHAKNLGRAIEYFSLAALNGHLVSELFLWRLKSKSFFQWFASLPYAARLFFKILAVQTRNADDLRVLT